MFDEKRAIDFPSGVSLWPLWVGGGGGYLLVQKVEKVKASKRSFVEKTIKKWFMRHTILSE